MEVKEIIKVLVLISSLIFLGFLISIPSRIKSLKNKTGKLILSLKQEWPLRSVLCLVFAGLLNFIILFRNFEIYMVVVFLCVALIATYLSTKNIVNSKFSGVYENMIISETTVIKYDDILSLPTVAYENDPDTTMVDWRVIEVLTKSGNKIQLIFSNEEERKQVLTEILKQCPRLSE